MNIVTKAKMGCLAMNMIETWVVAFQTTTLYIPAFTCTPKPFCGVHVKGGYTVHTHVNTCTLQYITHRKMG